MTTEEFNSTAECLLSVDSTCSNIYSSTAVHATLYVAATTVVLFTVCGNLLVIISICHFKQLHTPTNILILCLAIADFFVGLLVMPVHLLVLIESCLLFGPIFCSLYNLICFQLTCVSIYSVSFIAIDRYFELSNPFLYSKKVSVCVVSIVVLHIWVLSLFYNYMLLYFNGNFSNKCADKCPSFINAIWSFFDLLSVFVLPCATMIVLYIKIFFIARRHSVKIRATFRDRRTITVKNGTALKSETKAAKVLGILVSVFLICLVPYYICTFLPSLLADSYEHVMGNMLTLLYLNSTINPVIYALFYRWFRKSIKIILTFKICAADSSLISVL